MYIRCRISLLFESIFIQTQKGEEGKDYTYTLFLGNVQTRMEGFVRMQSAQVCQNFSDLI